MKLSSVQFTLCIVTLCVVGAAAYRSGQRAAPRTPTVALSQSAEKSASPFGQPAILVKGTLEKRLQDVGVSRYRPPFSLLIRRRTTIQYSDFLDTISPGPFVKVNVLERYGEASRVQITDPGEYYQKIGYVKTSKLRKDDGITPLDAKYPEKVELHYEF